MPTPKTKLSDAEDRSKTLRSGSHVSADDTGLAAGRSSLGWFDHPGFRWRLGRGGAAATAIATTFGLLGVTGLQAFLAALLGAVSGIVMPPRTQSRLHRSTLAVAVVVFSGALAFGVASAARSGGSAPEARPVAPPRSETAARTPNGPLADVFWIKYGTELGCREQGLNTELIRTQFVDVTGDTLPEAFVTYACQVATSSAPQQLEVFDGASDPEHPRRMGTLVKQSDGVDERGLRLRRLSFDGQTVTVDASAFGSDTANCCPNLRVVQRFRWNGSAFVAGRREVSPLG